jgi:hypothetical protein
MMTRTKETSTAFPEVSVNTGGRSTTASTQLGTDYSANTPVQLKRCGLETRLVCDNRNEEGAHSGSIQAIKKALKNALQWSEAVLQGKAKTLTDLARSEKLDQRYLSDLIILAYLAPDIQAAIIKGKLPSSVTLDWLKSHIPPCWDEQRKALDNDNNLSHI